MKGSIVNRRVDIFVALFLLTPSLVVFQQIETSLTEQQVVSGDALTNAAMYPRFIAIILFLLVSIELISIFRKTPSLVEVERVTQDEGRNEKFESQLILFSVMAYLIILPIAGYHISTPLLAAFVLWRLGITAVVSLVIAVGMSLVIALFFEVVLNVVLPTGVFNITLPI